MTKYLLTRTLPDGTVKTNPTPMDTLRQVATAAAYCLLDNSRVPRGEASRFAGELTAQPPGTAVRHEASGYAFRVDRV